MEEVYSEYNMSLLLESLKRKPLALFVGAGINYPIVPTWNELLNAILHKVLLMTLSLENIDQANINNLIQWHTASNLSLYEKATLIKVILDKQYLYFLKDILYQPSKAVPSETFKSVVELCRCKQVQAVVSYNYDDFLLTEVKKNRNANSAIEPAYYPYYKILDFSQDEISNIDNLPFYFVHGFIPREIHHLNSEKSNIVLSYDEYFNNMLNPYSWQTVTQVHFLRNYTCLFLGASLTDWNMLRMIEHAKDGHNSVFVLMSEQSIIDMDKDKKITDYERNCILRSKATIFGSFGIKLIISGESYDTLPDKINFIKEVLEGGRV